MSLLILLRHGESIWNHENKFTGWEDINLSKNGEQEALKASKHFKNNSITFDFAYTSFLTRAIRTLWIILEDMDKVWVPVTKDWRLNERHYGALQGLNKSDCVKNYGEEQVQIWRRSFSTKPPMLNKDDPRWQINDLRYAEISEGPPLSESLSDTCQRVIPYFSSNIEPKLKLGKNVLVVAHGNSLRALIKHLEKMDANEIQNINIPTGIPLIYNMDKNNNVLSKKYLGDQKELTSAEEAVKNQTKPN